MRRAASSLSRSSAAVGRLGRAAVVAVAVAALGGLGVAVSESTRTARAAPYRVLLASNRDGLFRGYSVRSDGSGLAPLLPRSRALAPVTVSGDGRTVAYVDPRKGHASGIYASRADGTDLRRVVAPRAGAPALSHDGRFLAFSKPGSPGIWIVGTDGRGARRLTRRADEGAQWSPDGKALVFLRSVGDYTQAIVVQPLRGTRRVIGYGDVYGLAWSPDGRWIAYSREEGDNLETPLWLVRPDGTGRRRVARDAGAFAWSPDGRTLALVSGRRLVVVGVDGRGRRIALHGLSPEGVIWLPGSRWLALAAGFPQQIWIVRSDGNGLRRVTAAGANQLVGWTRMTPALPPAQPLPATERIVRSNVLALRARVTSAAADGGRLAFSVGDSALDCRHVAMWEPARHAIQRFRFPAPCSIEETVSALGPVAIGGKLVAWLWTSLTGNHMETNEITSAGEFFDTAAISRGDSVGTVDLPPVGNGGVVAFAMQETCDSNASPGDRFACPPDFETGDVVATTVLRHRGPGPCPLNRGSEPPACTVVAKLKGEAHLLAVDGGRIVIGTEDGIALLDLRGRVLRHLHVAADAAALSGNRIAVAVDRDGVDVYDVRTARLAVQFPKLRGLQDLQGNLLVTASARTVTVRRLGSGHTTTFTADGTARARLEPPGLFVVGARRVTFTPMRELFRRLGG